MRAQLRYRRLNYDTARTTRPDDIEERVNAYASVGVPLGMLAPKTTQINGKTKNNWLRETLLEIGVNYNRREPEDGRRPFENFGIELRATANF